MHCNLSDSLIPTNTEMLSDPNTLSWLISTCPTSPPPSPFPTRAQTRLMICGADKAGRAWAGIPAAPSVCGWISPYNGVIASHAATAADQDNGEKFDPQLSSRDIGLAHTYNGALLILSNDSKIFNKLSVVL